MNISKLLKKYKYTSSPYIFYDNNMPSMYFTVLEDDKWHLYFTDNKIVTKVDFLQDMSIKNVTCFKNPLNELYCLSFCSEMNNVECLFYAETKDPTEIKVFTNLTRNIRGGIVTPNKIIYASIDNKILCYLNKSLIYSLLEYGNRELIKLKFIFDFKNITNISFLNGNLNKLIISYQDYLFAERRSSIVVDLTNLQDQKQILTEENTPMTDVTIDPFTYLVLYGRSLEFKNKYKKITKTYVKNLICNLVQVLK